MGDAAPAFPRKRPTQLRGSAACGLAALDLWARLKIRSDPQIKAKCEDPHP
jgi:hypothetical protein